MLQVRYSFLTIYLVFREALNQDGVFRTYDFKIY